MTGVFGNFPQMANSPSKYWLFLFLLFFSEWRCQAGRWPGMRTQVTRSSSQIPAFSWLASWALGPDMPLFLCATKHVGPNLPWLTWGARFAENPLYLDIHYSMKYFSGPELILILILMTDVNYPQVEAALQILLLLIGAPLLLLGVPIPSSNPGYNPSAQTHQIFRSPLKIQPGITADRDNQELTTPPSSTGTLFHSEAAEKTKQGREYFSGRRRGFRPSNGSRQRNKTTVVETNLLPCFPLSPEKQEKRIGGEEAFRWRKCIFSLVFTRSNLYAMRWEVLAEECSRKEGKVWARSRIADGGNVRHSVLPMWTPHHLHQMSTSF